MKESNMVFDDILMAKESNMDHYMQLIEQPPQKCQFFI